MKRFAIHTIFPLAVAAVLCGCATGEPGAVGAPTAEDRAQAGRMMYFYLDPDFDAAMRMLPALERISSADAGANMPVIGFVFGVASSMSAHSKELSRAARRHPGLAEPIENALAGKKFTDALPPREDLQPAHLDFIWGYYFATGDAEAARRIIERGAMNHLPSRSSLDGMISVDITAETAKWSVRSIAQNHPAVRAELDSFALSAGDEEILNFFGFMSAPPADRMDLRAKTLGLLTKKPFDRVSAILAAHDAKDAESAPKDERGT